MATNRRQSIIRPGGPVFLAAAWLAIAAVPAGRAAALAPPSEAIQKQREETERQKLDYMDEKARVDHVNERVRQYKELMAVIPFELAPNTTNMVRVFVNGHDIHSVAWRIYSISDQATEQGFATGYWPMVLYLNRAKDYDGRMPLYGKLNPQAPESNVALFPNVRKQGYRAVVAEIANADSNAALQMTAPVVLAYRQRLQEQLEQLAARSGDVAEVEGPAQVPAENHVPLFRGLPAEPRDQYPARRVTSNAFLVSTDPVAVDRPAPLDPLPPAWALRQGVNMLGPSYEGYNLQYTPDRFDLAPEFAPIAFLGGRDPVGKPRIQPGMHFGLNQLFFRWLRANESAFVAFSSGDAPSMNGGSLNVGLGGKLGIFSFAGLAGIAGINVDGEFVGGPSFTGKVRMRVGEHVQLLGLGVVSGIDHLRIERTDASGNVVGGQTGVLNATYFGVGVVLR